MALINHATQNGFQMGLKEDLSRWLNMDNETLRREVIKLYAKYRDPDSKAVVPLQMNEKAYRHLLNMAESIGMVTAEIWIREFPSQDGSYILYDIHLKHDTRNRDAGPGVIENTWFAVGTSKEQALARLLGMAMTEWSYKK